MSKLVATLALIVFAASCAQAPLPLPLLPNGKLDRSRILDGRCSRYGGTIKGVCMFGTRACVIPFPDAGKACTDTWQCMGRCWIEYQSDDIPMPKTGEPATGTCQPTSDSCACYAEIKNGKAEQEICVD